VDESITSAPWWYWPLVLFAFAISPVMYLATRGRR
jgi:hypothetical protein